MVAGGNTAVTRSIIASNYAYGGGVYLADHSNGSGYIYNTMISGNYARDSVGGLAILAELDLRNTIITGNGRQVTLTSMEITTVTVTIS